MPSDVVVEMATRLEHEGGDTGKSGTEANGDGTSCASGRWGRWSWGAGRALRLAINVLGADWSWRGCWWCLSGGWAPGRVAAWNWVWWGGAHDWSGGGGPGGGVYNWSGRGSAAPGALAGGAPGTALRAAPVATLVVVAWWSFCRDVSGIQ